VLSEMADEVGQVMGGGEQFEYGLAVIVAGLMSNHGPATAFQQV
jgi:hypothetical protein